MAEISGLVDAVVAAVARPRTEALGPVVLHQACSCRSVVSYLSGA